MAQDAGDEPVDEQQLSVVRRWLERVFEGGEAPQWPVTAPAVRALYGLAQRSQAQDQLSAAVVHDQKQRAAEYRAEGERQWPRADGHTRSLRSPLLPCLRAHRL